MDKRSILQSRREFIQFLGGSTVGLLGMGSFGGLALSACQSLAPSESSLVGITPTLKDDFVLHPSLRAQIICKAGEVINSRGDFFGAHNDFTSFLPLNQSGTEGLLWVNHESMHPEMIHRKQRRDLKRNREEIILEQKYLGGSILHLKFQEEQQAWNIQADSPYNRRIDARTPIPFAPASLIMDKGFAIGTLANCSGGQTPWKTFLTSEENYDAFYGEASWVNGARRVEHHPRKFQWYKVFPYPPEHYGWVVEINPMTGQAHKLVSLGRAPHEGATVTQTRDQTRAVVYMGEDRPGGYFFKFVSDGMHLNSGTLYAADTEKGRWLPLVWQSQKSLQKAFKDQLQVLTYAHQAAETVGATPLDRPEDIDVHPLTGDVFVSLTNNALLGNHYGSLLKISGQSDHDAVEFKAETWISGGFEAGLACPDNLHFDRRGNLWVTCDMNEKEIGGPTYSKFGNNGLFVIPAKGPQAGQVIQVASAPNDAELTGPWLSPDERTLFLSVQHPGALTRNDITKPTSQWPDGQGQMPRSAVVALRGPLLDQLSEAGS